MNDTSKLPVVSLMDMVRSQKKGNPTGIYSVCSSNPFVLETVMRQAREDGQPLLIESTSNQVNQFGGYMGMTPADFRQMLMQMAAKYQLAPGQVILGGDHLGPNVWQAEPAEPAMERANRLVADSVLAGYTKIHLDASMRLGGDPDSLPVELSAYRAAEMCKAAEVAWQSLNHNSPRPCYVIGTEVPIPGGAQEEEPELQVTPVENARHTIDITRQAFVNLGLQDAWERVIALVVQPGVEFGDTTIHPYQREKAAGLSRFIEEYPGLVYEAHSTDYQTPEALRELVEDHFAILKVGPGLTFAFREAVFALEWIERELLANKSTELSNLQNVIEREMIDHPEYWMKYYHGTPEEQRLARRFSLSDRIRYYWVRPAVQQSLNRLLSNLQGEAIPLTLISQYFPEQYWQIREGSLKNSPVELIRSQILRVVADYQYACYSERGE